MPPSHWKEAGRKALGAAKEAVRPVWSLLVERRINRTEEQLQQRMDLLFRIAQQRIDELSAEVAALRKQLQQRDDG